VQFNPTNQSSFENALKTNNPSLSSANVTSLTKYVLGDSTDEGSLWRKRSSLIGTIVNSSPKAIIKPKEIPDGCTYNNQSSVLNRPVYYAVAANDGMLHVMDENGMEKMGYIPRSALPKLQNIAQPSAVHEYVNDGSPIQAEMCFGTQAKSLLVGTAGRGGSSVYALDVTDLSNPGTSNILWDFSNEDDADLGLTVGKPVIAKNKAGNPLVVLSSGYNNASGKGHLYILRADKTNSWVQNSNYWKIPLGNSGVGEPFVYDADNDGIPEAVFVGDNDGKVWRINYDQATDTWSKGYGGSPLYTPSGTGSPITGAPFVQNVGEHLYVVVGTGRYFSSSDIAPTNQNYALGLFADVGPITDADLLQQTIDSNGTDVDAITSTTKNKLPQKLYSISTNPITSTHKGWRLKLLPGQSIIDSASIHRRRIATFTAIRSIANSAANACGLNGATARIGVDLKTGGQSKETLFDTNNDGNFDQHDQLGGMVEVSNILSPVSKTVNVLINGKPYTLTIFLGDNGSFHMHMNPLRSNAVRRISWREIF
ncbi:MAG: PilC/PilY family type IV pilus protein, partial [Neisseria sp.]|nr:PilC/PilY family type IV pilus protein [Neisseria sp.]